MNTMTATKVSLEGVPDLSISILVNHNDKVDALKLIADSVAQQRQITSYILIFHPYCLSALILVLSLAHISGSKDLSAMIVTYAGIVLVYLMSIRYFTSPYVHLAEDTNWLEWLGKDDFVIGTRFGSELIGTTVLRLEGGKGIIRAYTTKMRYRGKGLGADMLLEAVEIAKKTMGAKTEIEFAKGHANSKILLHPTFNKAIDTRDAKANRALAQAVVSWKS